MARYLTLILCGSLAFSPPLSAAVRFVPPAASKAPVSPMGFVKIGTIHLQNGFTLDNHGRVTLNGVLPDAAEAPTVAMQAAAIDAIASPSPEAVYIPALEWDEPRVKPSNAYRRMVTEPGRPLHRKKRAEEVVRKAVFPKADRLGRRDSILRLTTERFGWLKSQRPEEWGEIELEGGLRRLMDGAEGAGGTGASGSVRGSEQNSAATPGLTPAGEGKLHAPEQDVPEPKAKEHDPRAEQARAMRRYKMWTWILGPIFNLLYRPLLRGGKNIPKTGPALLLPNHVTWLDVFLISYKMGRPVRFLMHKDYYESPRMNWFVKQFRPIPIAPGNPKQVDKALNEARQALKDGDVVAIFPEGSFTWNGNLKRFKRGMETILKGLDVPTIPVHLDGFWGSFFSKKRGSSIWTELTRQWASHVLVRFGRPLRNATVDTARDAVEQLSAMNMRERILRERRPLGRSFVRAAYRFWNNKAVSDSTGKSLSYGKLLTGSLLLGRALAPSLAGEKNVGVFLPPSVGGALANTTLTQLGKVTVNLNYTASRDSVVQATEIGEVQTVLTSRKFIEALEKKTGITYDLPVNWIFLEDLAPLIPQWKKTLTYILLRILPWRLAERLLFKRADAPMNEDATLIFTSGSTGAPKGVRLSHLNIQSNIKMMEEVFSFTPQDTMLGVLPFFHSFGFTETLWMPLLNGVHAVYHTSPFETDAIDELSKEYDPTILLGTPSFLRRYKKEVSAEAFAKLKLVIAGAEKLYVRDADGFQKKFGARPLEGYGATETSPVSAVNVPDRFQDDGGVHPVGQQGNKSGSVGHPPPGVAIRIVDPESGEFLPAGSEGVVLIKGPHVMSGYYGDRMRSDEVLQNGWYYTGDVGYRDRDGFLFLTGRLSRFSKIGGEMVSHDLVEEKLHEAIGASERRFAVAGAPDSKMGEKLVVLYEDFEGDVSELLEKVGTSLSRIAKPREVNFYRVDAIPLLGSGKMDLKAVQQIALERDAQGE